VVGPVPPGDRILRALAELWMLFPTEDQYREWFERAGFEDVSLVTVAPDWYRDRRSRYAVAVTGRKAVAGPSPLVPAGAPEDLRAPLGLRGRLVFAGRFVLGSLAGAVFVPVGIALALRARLGGAR
jgi:MPBQ/MSBQ methyltransferase